MRNQDNARCAHGVLLVAQQLMRTNSASPLASLSQVQNGLASILQFALQGAPAVETSASDPHSSSSTSSSQIKIRTVQEPPSLTTKARAVPASKVGRVLGFGELAVGLAAGSVSEVFKRGFGGGSSGSVAMSEANAERLASGLCRMRGSALKLGQMLSIQDESLLPPYLSQALERVRQGADIMPEKQLERVLTNELGVDWRDSFEQFSMKPFASASLGQVHFGKVDAVPVAVKVQFPGVADSIDSDFLNLQRLSSVTGIFPKGLFIDRIVEVMKEELREECEYSKEIQHQEKFRRLLADDQDSFFVPKTYPELSTNRVLTSEFATGIPIDKVAALLPQEDLNDIGRKLLKLTLRELFEFRYMQTDPNFSNYLYDLDTRRIVLLDFGATRSYGREFVDDYLELVWASSKGDRSRILEQSIKLGFLTGSESQEMINAHIESGLEVGRPFQRNGDFDFKGSNIAKQMSKHGNTFVNERLVPPPKEVYSLHRKLSGAYMTCIRIGAVFNCRDMLVETYDKYPK